MGTRAGAALDVPIARLRAFWLEKQALGKARAKSPADALRSGGWMNSAGGSGPYLAMRARLAKGGRADVDRAAFADGSIVEVPAMRQCMMLVPRADRALALRCAREMHAERLGKLHELCGLTSKEMDALSKAVVKALESGALAMDALRERIPPKLIRALGDEGRRLGETSTLTAAMHDLQVRGLVQRRAETRRLDASRFEYALSEEPDFDEGADLTLEIARRVLRWAGPATAGEIAWWACARQKDVKAALAALEAQPVRADGWAAAGWALPEDADALMRAKEAAGDDVRALPFRDNYLSFRRRAGAFVAPEAAATRVLDWMNRPAPIGTVESVHHHALVAGGRIVGLWDFDAEAGAVVSCAIEKLAPKARARFDEEVVALGRFVGDELGDVKFYAFDSGRQRGPRLDAIRALVKLRPS